MKPSVVVSLGGNAILPANNAGTIEEQFRVTRQTLSQIVDLAADNRLVLTHGNGPIVGNILIRNEAARRQVPPMPLDVCGADSQGGIGYMIQQTLANLFRERGLVYPVATIVTQVVVDPEDPGFRNPTKPIGPFYDEETARRFEREKGWKMGQDSGRGWRRVVASPIPRRIVEMESIRTLHDAGQVVIAGGGGGIPVVEEDDAGMRGVEAVVDKDLVSVVLALALGAKRLLIITAVVRVAVDFGTPEQRPIASMSIAEANRHLADGQFPPGSMGPKIEASVRFLEEGGEEVCITSPAKLQDALHGREGTWIRR
ncbi:MAG: carbamate kinase, partial [Candidatus Eisenbacteria bacterium]|nr:carbamate kinase [Candidatus Latescibacterota bacterium]MBD3300972.1 carbamate kinase [Candidatus Eisenbacteria bacterium]